MKNENDKCKCGHERFVHLNWAALVQPNIVGLMFGSSTHHSQDTKCHQYKCECKKFVKVKATPQEVA